MSERASFQRKIIYWVALIVLAITMFWLSTPATATKDGGKLAQLRKDYKLSQANLGEVDPASETMRFLTLGLRGVAVTVLWEKANYYKKTEDWTNLTATLEQLAKLNPNFIIFWKYQAWNLTYNVSVEFDDYRDRYYYVRRGIEFLKEGERYNVDNPQLLSDLGWFIGHKIGRADEHVLYRRLFKADDDFHPPDRTPDQRDNWLVSKYWYGQAINAVDTKGKSIGKKSPREFYSDPAKAQINYAEAIEEDGFFEKSRRAWTLAGEEWRAFGRLPIEHSSGVRLRLGDEPRLKQETADLRAQLDAQGPELRARLAEERLQALTPEQRKLRETPREKVEADQSEEWYALEFKVAVTDRDVAERIARDKPENAASVLKLVRQLEEAERTLRFTQNYKSVVNFEYWQLRCDFEQSANAQAAREFMFRAYKEQVAANVTVAKQWYQQGFAKLRAAFDEFPAILDDSPVVGENLIDYTKKYREVLDLNGESLDESFPVWDALAKFDQENVFANELARHRQLQSPDKSGTPAGEAKK